MACRTWFARRRFIHLHPASRWLFKCWPAEKFATLCDALAARARLFVGVDSAPMHIAAAMCTPTVAIFGPSGDKEWGPWNVAHRVVASQTHPCRPCGRDGCEGSKVSRCLTELPLEAVLAACEALLAETNRT